MVRERFWEFIGSKKFAVKGYTWFRNFLLWSGLARHDCRQNFPLGFLKTKDAKRLEDCLRRDGWEKDFYSWVDPGEILNLRKVDQGRYQYHLRIFRDGEARGHYEFAPDRLPLKHFFARKFEERSDYFKELLKRYLEN